MLDTSIERKSNNNEIKDKRIYFFFRDRYFIITPFKDLALFSSVSVSIDSVSRLVPFEKDRPEN